MFKIGHSHDTHQLEKDQGLIIGGVKIDAPFGTIAHSDGDVLVHAITESIIGALGLGDIGTFFPDNDEQYKDINSLELLNIINNIMIENGYHINNIDCMIFLEKPKLLPYINDMKNNIANVLNINTSQINIKSTRGEKVGPIGLSQAISSEAVVLISND